MTLLNTLLLGIIQGLTEFLPISSTAHLLIMSKLLGIASDDKFVAFSVIVQLGTVLAMLVYFWKDFMQIVVAFLLGIRHKKPFEDSYSRLGWLVIVATIPALIIGFLLKDVIKSMFAEPFTQAGVRLLVTAVLLSGVEYFGRRDRTLSSVNWMDALWVGFFQVLAIFPGGSRSGTTISGGMVRGFDRQSAARFAFLMSAPILLAAGAYEFLKVLEMQGTRAFLPSLFTGFVAAAVVGWFAIHWLIRYLGRHSLYMFAIYCAVLGVVVLFLQFM